MSQNILAPPFDFIAAGKQVLAIEREGLAQLNQYINDYFPRACEALFRCTGKVVVMGMGKSSHIGRKLAATFASTGTRAFFVHPGEASHCDLGMVSPQDIVIAPSNAGESHEVADSGAQAPAHPAHLHDRQTGQHHGESGENPSCVHVPEEACPLGMAPTTITTAELVIGDALAGALLRSRGFTAEDFDLSHPGGALGRKLLLRVSDIMHSDDDIPLTARTASLRDELLEITGKNLGITVICDAQNVITGIFTNDDLRRMFDMGIDLNRARIADFRTPGGGRVAPDMLAVEALNLMQATQHYLAAGNAGRPPDRRGAHA